MIQRLRHVIAWNVLGILAILSVIIIPTSVKADSLMDVIYTDEETTEDFSKAYSTPKARGAYLAYGVGQITKLSDMKLNVYGETAAARDSYLTLEMYLERKQDGSYYTYKMWEFYREDAPLLTASINVLVPTGTFYRLSTYHAAKNGVTRESTGATTYGIYMG
ncbi:MAG: hypothetical protein Q4E89_07900 [Eubacteriales bacterium]|nr:hypothetical protein [Eubacteriales bacterium]